MRSLHLLIFGALMLLTFYVQATTHYVDANGTNPISPYTNWSTAALNIQNAVDASTNGDLVLVTNGIYATGGRRWFDSGTNRVTLTNAVTLQSVNGPGFTWIVGNQVCRHRADSDQHRPLCRHGQWRHPVGLHPDQWRGGRGKLSHWRRRR